MQNKPKKRNEPKSPTVRLCRIAITAQLPRSLKPGSTRQNKAKLTRRVILNAVKDLNVAKKRNEPKLTANSVSSRPPSRDPGRLCWATKNKTNLNSICIYEKTKRTQNDWFIFSHTELGRTSLPRQSLSDGAGRNRIGRRRVPRYRDRSSYGSKNNPVPVSYRPG